MNLKDQIIVLKYKVAFLNFNNQVYGLYRAKNLLFQSNIKIHLECLRSIKKEVKKINLK